MKDDPFPPPPKRGMDPDNPFPLRLGHKILYACLIAAAVLGVILRLIE